MNLNNQLLIILSISFLLNCFSLYYYLHKADPIEYDFSFYEKQIQQRDSTIKVLYNDIDSLTDLNISNYEIIDSLEKIKSNIKNEKHEKLNFISNATNAELDSFIRSSWK
jgi:hypothetical protein